MSKLILIYHKNFNSEVDFSEKRIESISNRLTPDNLNPKPLIALRKGNLGFIVLNPTNSIKIHNTNVCMGTIVDEKSNWHQTFSKNPIGSYAIFRSDDQFLELLTDAVASRTIWYYRDDNKFIASTSQRAIVMLMGTFKFNPQVVPWMLTSGVTGPDYSYDKRILKMPPDAKYVLNLKNWCESIQKADISFNFRKEKKEEYKINLKKELDFVFSKYSNTLKDWVIPLSGGVDSRGILILFLQHHAKFRTITWGTNESIGQRGSDAYVARRLSDRLKVENLFIPIENNLYTFSKIFDRFIISGEGRIDHLSGYLDGFELWNRLFSMNIQGIIRGDEGFGWGKVYNDQDVLHSLGINIYSESKFWKNIKNIGIPEPEFPESFKRQHLESLSDWRDRLYHLYRIPVMLSALNDLKLSYLEISNPFLSQNILDFVRTIPEKFRTNKALFKNYIAEISPPIPFATRSSLQDHLEVIKKTEYLKFIIDYLSQRRNNDVFSSEFMDNVLNLGKAQTDFSAINEYHPHIYAKIKRVLPTKVKSMIRSRLSIKDLDIRLLLFRMVILLKMNEILKSDALFHSTKFNSL